MNVIYRDGYVCENGIERPMTQEEKKRFPPYPTRSPIIDIDMEYPEQDYAREGKCIGVRLAMIVMVLALFALL